jgi:glycosyltransferase involved in cell wall biosynthesis
MTGLNSLLQWHASAIILLDDCSTDDSRLILSKYADDPRVRIEFNKVNSGSPFKQWNKGVSLALGEYVWIAESDDYADKRLLDAAMNPRLCFSTPALSYTIEHKNLPD